MAKVGSSNSFTHSLRGFHAGTQVFGCYDGGCCHYDLGVWRRAVRSPDDNPPEAVHPRGGSRARETHGVQAFLPGSRDGNEKTRRALSGLCPSARRQESVHEFHLVLLRTGSARNDGPDAVSELFRLELLQQVGATEALKGTASTNVGTFGYRAARRSNSCKTAAPISPVPTMVAPSDLMS